MAEAGELHSDPHSREGNACAPINVEAGPEGLRSRIDVRFVQPNSGETWLWSAITSSTCSLSAA